MEVAAITAGPVKNLTAIANVATLLPQEIIFGWSAMNRPRSHVAPSEFLGSCKEQNISSNEEQVSNSQCLYLS